MKNRIKKILFGSITRELLLVNIVSFALVVIGVIIAIGMLYANFDSKDTPDKMIADANSLYVEVGRYVTREDEGSNNYLKQLGKHYGFNAAVTDSRGNIILKTANVNTDKIDVEKVQQIFQGKAYRSNDTFYQIYNVKLGNKDAMLFVWKLPQLNRITNIGKIIVLIGILPVIIVVVLIYILIRRKAKYIKDICRGIETISQGNLDYRIDKKGVDELSILSDKINSMTIDLKNIMEDERKAERLKSELMTNVSHDLRTPLTSLIAYLQLADDDKTSLKDKEKFTEIALQKSNKLKKLIDDLFEYSKLESGAIKLGKEEINIVEIIEQSIGELSILAKKRNITFHKSFSNSIFLKVDPNKIGRVFENVISNAVKYSTEGSTIYIDISQKNDGLIISFENIINEIFEENVEKLFDRFYRTDEARNSEQGGSGLGLAIAKNIIELHGGIIWAEVEQKNFKMNIRLN
ncbi:HAMP domain-containing sensor histidine kinase [Clostridium pasteurianum]|uniref:histidine kinase n=1 Tax=Clostridium pasteurianum BC1 TaxID=86416 RepID=R4K9E5_CLOPA|nr:ATP-binding protein [Clostridium pasteurianum]AGK97144.1 histidine kinase,HAMP domain-containing protein,histidine kinase [Clostridium pasteurianum BC1]